eukprot:GFYU01003085.1.p1 GENE.GFYU01003085.1~~GFYU01003085.1.p1  ORF type:complete len:527 (-),score=177.37 GFYU01003085.1:203-1783(-)
MGGCGSSCKAPEDDMSTRGSDYAASDAGERPEVQISEDKNPEVRKALESKALTVVVFGASGDLAKKKTYPALFELFVKNFLPKKTKIIGYARKEIDLEKNVRQYLKGNESDIDAFFKICSYTSGQYDVGADYENLDSKIADAESASKLKEGNRLFYLALPPVVFADAAKGIKENCYGKSGWNRLVVEKPFGHDADSSEKLAKDLLKYWQEEEIYRIDHYLGKEMVQNLLVLRFANRMFYPLWHHEHIKCVQITFKEPFGTEGRGGYFDKSGIIRDIIQNHLMQVLTCFALERPVGLGPEDIRDEKVKVLKAIKNLTVENVVTGQYAAHEGKPGYLDDEGVPKDSVCPTFAVCVLKIDNERWSGVPFILKAGKALNERKAEVRVQFKDVPGSLYADTAHHNEIVFRLQPNEAVYCKMNAKTPGLSSEVLETDMDLTYNKQLEGYDMPDAYTRLILDCIYGDHANFVRSDELRESWRIFTPLLHKLEQDKIKPIPYKYGGRGPAEADKMIADHGYVRSTNYTWKPSKY